MASDLGVLDAGPALAAPGSRHSLAVAFPVAGAGLPEVEVPADVDVAVDVVLEAQGSQVVAEGTVQAPWMGTCRRCLEPTSGRVEVAFREVFAATVVEGETYPLVDQELDLVPMLRETLILALPAAPLCAEGCGGPDPDAHPVGIEDEGSDAGAAPAQDARWAALDELRFDA